MMRSVWPLLAAVTSVAADYSVSPGNLSTTLSSATTTPGTCAAEVVTQTQTIHDTQWKTKTSTTTCYETKTKTSTDTKWKTSTTTCYETKWNTTTLWDTTTYYNTTTDYETDTVTFTTVSPFDHSSIHC